jgi:uncharacterized protein (TIGR03083 family)
MSAALKAIEVGRTDVLEICAAIPDSMWAQESGCPGWSVQDLVSHMACSFWLAVDPTTLPDPGGIPAERAADLYVESRRSMSPEEVVADYDSVSMKGLELLAMVEGQDVEVPLGDVGTYPASVVPTAFAFEILVHTQCDLFAPNGPLKGNPPPCDDLRLSPTLDWIEAALPQQNSTLIDQIGAVEIELDGVSTRTLRIGRGGDTIAHIASDSAAFMWWITQRGSWDDLGVKAEGDAAALDAVRRLRVF